eukprot:TRINITY_DN10856_c0_g1_i1.p1 TRINITY_DN10856_c0_g1~~TRINITY_DN10856_c0_g1_i1.p1  ORF type:complete len:247 (+),score=40.73 TRINITY_DN10856_c0_g1_i1:69-809(+)
MGGATFLQVSSNNVGRKDTSSSELYPRHKLQQSVIEHAAKPLKHNQLKKLGRQLGDYCSILPGDETAEHCWTAYHYYEDKKKRLLQGCDIEHDPQVCENLDRFEDAVRELSYSGLPTIVNSLYNMALREQKHQQSIYRSTSGYQSDEEKEAELKDLFDKVDSNKNGEIDVGEFRAAMQMLGERLSGETVATICEAMDVHGYLNFQQFKAIMEAIEITAHTETSKVLRSVCHEDRPGWWTNCPESIA